MPSSGEPRHASRAALALLRRTADRLSAAQDAQQVLRCVATSCAESLGQEDCVVYLRADDRPVMVQSAAVGAKSPGGVEVLEPTETRIGRGIVGQCAARAETVLVADALTHSRYFSPEGPYRSRLAVPIIDEGEVIGVIDSEHSEPEFFDDADADLVGTIAAMVAGRLRSALNQEHLRATVDQLQRAEKDLRRAAGRDDLTGLQNRSAFDDELRDAEKSGDGAVLVLLDIDRFKTLNDTYGHTLGDGVIRGFAGVLKEMVPDGAVAARVNGDEFAVVFPRPDLMSARSWADSLRATVKGRRLGDGGADVDITLSAGLAVVSADSWDHAQEALYLAKDSGRDRSEVYNPDDPRMAERSDAREWARRLVTAASDGRLVLARQPIRRLDGDEGDEIGEFLLRYDDGRLVLPGRFLGAAERFGLMRDLDRWVLDSACATLANEEDTRGCVNVSVPFALSGQFVGAVKAALTRSGLDPSRLTLEIIETAAIVDPGVLAPALTELHRLGCRIAIDDFGSGWSSLDLVRALPVDILKIDGRWVCNAPGDALSSAVVRSVTEIGHLVGAQVVAEWVETPQTRDFLAGCGVDFGQGLLLGGPEMIGVPVLNTGGLLRI